MPTNDELRRLLNVDEPDYPTLARTVGPEAAADLATIAAGSDVMLASKAVYLASLLPDGTAVVAAAAAADDPILHAAAASALRNLTPQAGEDVAATLLERDDVAVQKIALRAVGPELSTRLRDRLAQLAEGSPSARVRDESRRRLPD